ncbi:putative polyketide synthase, partial [Aspergillus nomiae NRRL 13137]
LSASKQHPDTKSLLFQNTLDPAFNMVTSTSNTKSESLKLVFGPQDPNLDDTFLQTLRTTLLETPELEWVVDTLTQLPREWQKIADAHPELAAFQGQRYLDLLNKWVRRGVLPSNLFPLPNILVTPLVVTTQLAQYTKFVKQINPGFSSNDSLQGILKLDTETVGLCTGLISSAAVASSANLAELQKHGAAAIRMATAIGALVDAGDSDHEDGDRWQSLAVGWTAHALESKLDSIVDSFPEAYVSVISEARLATLTVLKTDAPQLLEKLKDTGFIFTKTGLRGPFHCGKRENQAASLLRLFDSDPSFQFPHASQLVFGMRSANGGRFQLEDKLHHAVARAMLTDKADWHKLFTTLHESTSTRPYLTICFGSQSFVPQWFLRKLGPKLAYAADLDFTSAQLPPALGALLGPIEDNAIAVVGMACHFPGGSDLDEFWDTICAAKSQCTEVPSDRINFDYAAWRENDKNRKWFGNFVRDHDAFDHKFFQKSPREMVSCDPQHRMMLQVAYQAVQQSGYFNKAAIDQHVGCYVGIGVADYENNVACHTPTAYTATGNLKSFAAGKISHFFGWSGPGVTIDTACSSSALAVHHACNAILNGECHAALAGGVNVMTSPEWYQNLDGASFLSPTGQCKPFDEAADGYCRGEGAGAVFLKKLSAAIEDGDQVLGVIRGSAVNQNANCSAITAPSVQSLTSVFNGVLRKARLDPKQISVVEAHGTGTQVGDRAEYDSVRRVLGGQGRAEPVSLGSVKGLIGHLECASGVAALIKVLLMIQNGAIPPQSSFRTISSKLNASPLDNVEISTSMRSWATDFRAALLNNYGASGSNASLVITQADNLHLDGETRRVREAVAGKRPFWFSGIDDKSLRSYATKMVRFLQSRKPNDHRFTIENLSYQLAHQSNRLLGQSLMFSCVSVDELEAKLASFADGRGELTSAQRQQSSRPVILCFGGQRSNFVGLDREAYYQFKLLRTYLDQCHETCLSLGLEGIIPAIFERTPRRSIVELQTMQFALQYACAKSWIDSGVQVTALVGHSFGELTAMCVSGTLSVEDTLKMIAGRARLLEANWGLDRGSMMAVDGELESVQRLLRETNAAQTTEPPINIACYNGPRQFTIAGTSKAMEAVKQTLLSDPSFTSIKAKQLDITHAFHSALVDPLVPELERLGEDLIFRSLAIPHERATQEAISGPPAFNIFASHMRDPVYFDRAVQRLAQKYPGSIWLEAGSGSGVTALASRAAGSHGMTFQSINITSSGAVQNMADATVNLWKEGVNVAFWEHVEQTSSHSLLLLPPYQFAKSRHWLERRKPEAKEATPVPSLPKPPKGLWAFMGFQDSGNTHARFQIHATSDEFKKYVGAHLVAQTAPICPSMLQHVMAREALASLLEDSDMIPELENMENDAPLFLDESKLVWLDAYRTDSESTSWDFRITSVNKDNAGDNATKHVSGRLLFRSFRDASKIFTTCERLVDRRRALALLDGQEAEHVIQGSRNIYKVFAPVVQYNDDTYKGLQKIAATRNESAGRIVMQDAAQTILSVGLADTFCQVAGIYLNCMAECEDGKMYLSNRVERWIRSPDVPLDSRPEHWEVYAIHNHSSPKEYVSDLFVFDATTGQLVWVILGLHFVEVSFAGMSRLLGRFAGVQPAQQAPAPEPLAALPAIVSPAAKAPVIKPKANGFIDSAAPQSQQAKPKKAPGRDVLDGVRDLFCNLLGLEPEDIQPSSDLVELGIDSLLAMEVAREVEKAFSIKFELEELMQMTDVRSLVNCVQANMGASDSSVTDGDLSDGFEETSGDSGIQTPPSEPAEEVKSVATGGALSAELIIDAFTETKTLTDQFIEQSNLSGYSNYVQPKLTELVVAHTLDAFEQLGCSLHSAQAGQTIKRIPHLPKHDKVMAVLTGLLEKARLVDLDGLSMIRTAVPLPTKSAPQLLQELLREYPEHSYDHKLTSLTGSRLADCLSGKTEAIQLLFGSAEGRELAAGMYGKSPINVAWLRQLQHFWQRFIAHIPQQQQQPINILEMGAGTGGTTAALLPLLASSGVPVRYTATDISPSLVAGLRKRFKNYPWMSFEVIDIEKAPPTKLLETQHVVLATNCVHATHSLAATTKNIHRILRPDGFLIMLEMTEAVPWVDSVFGLVEGWWLFNDGRTHALAQPDLWQRTLRANGYGHVDWSDGQLPENSIQRIIIALASPQSQNLVSICPPASSISTADLAARQVVVDSLVQKHTLDFTVPTSLSTSQTNYDSSRYVLVTGATGSLGSHLVAHFAAQPDVRKVICLNRISGSDATTRQLEALQSRGLELHQNLLSKVEAIETNSSAPMLGLSLTEYQHLVNCVTDVVHNAWAMSMTRPARGFETQFKAIRNLIDLCRDAACQRRPGMQKIGFQFVSSVSVVGCHPFLTHKARVPEQRVNVASALSMGYADAKLICEKMLDETLHRHPEHFRTMSVRVGQISGSKVNGYWNPVEHLVHLIKSSQSLGVLPDLDGALSWCPVNDVASTLGDLLLRDEPAYPIYHIENPVRQPWPEMISILSDALEIPQANIVPYEKWLQRVRNYPPSIAGSENPAVRLIDFFETDFLRMSCGGMILDTTQSKEHSATLRSLGPIDRELVMKYIRAWKDSGFLL